MQQTARPPAQRTARRSRVGPLAGLLQRGRNRLPERTVLRYGVTPFLLFG